MPKEVKEIQRSSKSLHSREVFFNDVRSDCHSVSFLGVVSIKTKSIKILMFNFRVWKLDEIGPSVVSVCFCLQLEL